MSKTHPTDPAGPTGPTSLTRATLALLKRQWAGLGAAGSAGADTACVSDPEALIIAGALFGTDDPKLHEEISVWIKAHESLVNVQRLRNIILSFGPQAAPDISASVRRVAGEGRKSLKWKKFFTEPKAAKEKSTFSYGTTGPAGSLKAAESAAKGYSFDSESHGGLRPIPMGKNSSLLLRLRELFGVNMRADVINYLLGNDEGYPREIARALFFSQKGIQDTLAGMARSGMVRVRSKGREKRYWLEHERWEALAGPFDAPPRWINYALIFRAVIMVWYCLGRNEKSADAEKDNTLEQAHRDLQDAGFARRLPDIGKADREEGWAKLVDGILEILEAV